MLQSHESSMRYTATPLIDAATGTHVWADRYDRDLTDVFAVQDEVIREIVGAVTLRLTPDTRRRGKPALRAVASR